MTPLNEIANQLEGSQITKVENIKLQDWKIELEEKLLAKKKFSLILRQCIYIDFKGFKYQT